MPPSPAAFAAAPLFEPIAGLLSGFSDGLPSADSLTALLGRMAPTARSGSGRPIRFILPPAELPAYEQHIHATGEVPTRADDWHDFFNALVWLSFPQTKTVVSTDPAIPALLAAHEWEEVFWNRRAQLLASTRFLIFGHGSWDQLRQPFFGLCAKAIYRHVDAAWLALPAAQRQRETDAWLAARFTDPLHPFANAALSPLPLLGIPGVTPDNAVPDYYRDTRQFRPKRLSPKKTAVPGPGA